MLLITGEHADRERSNGTRVGNKCAGAVDGFNDSEAKDETVTPYAPSEPLVVTTVTPEANRPAA
jgi:hypothetical protein